MTDRNAHRFPELDSLSAEDLTHLIGQAEAKRAEKLEGARAALVQEMREKAAALGLPLEALLHAHAPVRSNAGPGRSGNGGAGRPARRGTGVKVAAKFRGPNGEEWTGRGRMPNWLKAQEAEGRKRSDFAIG